MVGVKVPYKFYPDKNIIRVYYGPDLDMSYFKRRHTQGEERIKNIDSLLRKSTGLHRIYRKYDYGLKFVDFKIKASLYNQAAVALRLAYEQDNAHEVLLNLHPPK